jgi:hypothetical protein
MNRLDLVQMTKDALVAIKRKFRIAGTGRRKDDIIMYILSFIASPRMSEVPDIQPLLRMDRQNLEQMTTNDLMTIKLTFRIPGTCRQKDDIIANILSFIASARIQNNHLNEIPDLQIIMHGQTTLRTNE